jgi:hypothetical protein
MIRMRGKGVTYGEIWFDEEPVAPLPDILICRQRSRPWINQKNQDFVTLLIDLTQDEAALLGAFGKSNRYQIRRAENKDGGTYTFIQQPERALDAFGRFYDQFAATKALEPINRTWLKEAATAGRLFLTHAAQAGEIQVWHAYIVSRDRARLIYSASLFRESDKMLQATIGRLNRWLHWQDMLEFKRRGFNIYDFGGLFSDTASPMAMGINQFKQEFGGARACNFDCTVAVTWKGRLYLALLNLKNRYGRRFLA